MKKTDGKRQRGRPAMITLEVVQSIGERIAKGMTEEQACLLLGVSYPAFKKAQQRNPTFVLAIKKAHAEFLDHALGVIAKGGEIEEVVTERITKADGSVVEKLDRRVRPWTGVAWILERRHKPQFSRTDIHAVTTPTAEGLFVFTKEDQAEMEAMARKMFCGPEEANSAGRRALMLTMH